MSPDTLFQVCNTGVIPFWLLLAVAPGWEWTQRLVHSVGLPVLLAGAYVYCFATAPAAPEGASFGSLEGVMLFFTVAQSALAGWIHYLAFDLFVGAWEVRDARRQGIPHLAVLPCLLFTLMLGPIGFALYAGLRFAMRGTGSLVEAPAPAS